MISFFPRQIANKGVYLYLGSLASVSIIFFSHAMSLLFIIIGIAWVTIFFLLGSYLSKQWQNIPEKRFLRNVLLVGLVLRFLWVFFSYFFYILKTGIPFEFSPGDSIWYFEESAGNYQTKLNNVWSYLFINTDGISDSGYVFYLTLLVKIFGPYILPIRLINSLFSTATIALVYLLAKRNIGEEGARLAAIFTCLMPNFIYYCGLHLKEVVMLFLLVAALERADFVLRVQKRLWLNIPLLVFLVISLFTFRTVLGGAIILSIATALIVSSKRVIGTWRKVMLIGWGLLAVFTFAGGTITTEAEGYWEQRELNQDAKRSMQTAKGNQWAKYATGTVMAPMMFVMPFPTMVDVDEQYNQQIISGGNFVRNFLGGFVLIALFSAIFIKKNWRDLSLIGAFVIAYLGIVSTSGFANSERFLLPALPGLLIMAAYGMTQLDAKNYRFIKIWYWIVPVMAIAWAFFKLGSRGLF